MVRNVPFYRLSLKVWNSHHFKSFFFNLFKLNHWMDISDLILNAHWIESFLGPIQCLHEFSKRIEHGYPTHPLSHLKRGQRRQRGRGKQRGEKGPKKQKVLQNLLLKLKPLRISASSVSRFWFWHVSVRKFLEFDIVEFDIEMRCCEVKSFVGFAQNMSVKCQNWRSSWWGPFWNWKEMFYYWKENCRKHNRPRLLTHVIFLSIAHHDNI